MAKHQSRHEQQEPTSAASIAPARMPPGDCPTPSLASVSIMMSPSTCALLAQVFPVFLLVFAVRDGQIVRSIRRERLQSGLAGWPHWLSRLRSNRAAWVAVTAYFLFMEAWLIAASDGAWPMPIHAGYAALVVLLFYAAIELWAHVLPGDEASSDGATRQEPFA